MGIIKAIITCCEKEEYAFPFCERERAHGEKRDERKCGRSLWSIGKPTFWLVTPKREFAMN